MIKTYIDFAHWVWELPHGNQVVLDGFPMGSSGQPMTIDKFRDMIYQINRRSPAICLTLLSPSVENGYRPTLRRYDGWESAIRNILETYKTPISNEMNEAFRRVRRPLIDDMDDTSEVIEDGDVDYMRVIASKWNQRHPNEMVTVSKIEAGVLIDANRSTMTARECYRGKFADIPDDGLYVTVEAIRYVRLLVSEWNGENSVKLTVIKKGDGYRIFSRTAVTRMMDIVRDCGDVPDGKVAYARVCASRWNQANPNDRRSVVDSGGRYVIRASASGGSDFYQEVERVGVAVVGLNKALRSTKTVQVVHYTEHTVGYRRDADLLLRRWNWEKNGRTDGPDISSAPASQ